MVLFGESVSEAIDNETDPQLATTSTQSNLNGEWLRMATSLSSDLNWRNMPDRPGDRGTPNGGRLSRELALWASGLWALPLITIMLWVKPAGPKWDTSSRPSRGVLLAPLPALIWSYRQRRRLLDLIADAEEETAQLKLQLETVRYRTSRLREELQAADKQARLSHQLTLLGQFTAGFMHEFNNPLAIVAGRLEVLLEERKDDGALCADIEQMLKETRYMGQIAGTLLQALRRERGGARSSNRVIPDRRSQRRLLPSSRLPNAQTASLVEEIGEAPRVDVPEHVIGEVVRGLLSNALKALEGTQQGIVWVRLEPYRTAGAKVVIRIEDNGPGVPEAIRTHLFEPFITQSSGREQLGLGLFLAASLLDMYDGRIRYATRERRRRELHYGIASSAIYARPALSLVCRGNNRVSRIFVIDDEAALGENIQRMLRLPGVTVIGFVDPVKGLSEALAMPPDLVLLDMRMPGMSGEEVFARLHQAHPALAHHLSHRLWVGGRCCAGDTQWRLRLSAETVQTRRPFAGGESRPFARFARKRGCATEGPA